MKLEKTVEFIDFLVDYC